jgi:hypothetical protein
MYIMAVYGYAKFKKNAVFATSSCGLFLTCRKKKGLEIAEIGNSKYVHRYNRTIEHSIYLLLLRAGADMNIRFPWSLGDTDSLILHLIATPFYLLLNFVLDTGSLGYKP